VSPRVRVSALVALIALVAAGVVVGVVVLQTRGEQTGVVGVGKARAGHPPLFLDLGVRIDPEAQALRRALQLYSQRDYAAAAAIFRRYGSEQAQLGEAFATWSDGGLERVKQIVSSHPSTGDAQLALALADLWAGRTADATAAFRATRQEHPDTQAAIDAADFLYPGPPGLPPFVPAFAAPVSIEKLSPPQRLAALARAATRPDARAKLLYGTALQSLGRSVSAEREFAAAAKLAPQDPEARVAAIIGSFDKAHPQAIFPRLGPLVRVFPHAPTVRFHLGLALIWIGQFRQARIELRRTVAETPRSPLARQAKILLQTLARSGTK
jgi:tetratricopeptide (TPR) repeat protein